MERSVVDEVKERLPITDVVGTYVKLTKAGKYYRGLSPFNKEKSPSFFVSPERNRYHCFSSGKDGDIFTFVEEMEGVDFKGALKILAERAGVSLRPENPKAREERERTYDALEEATRFFEANLKKAGNAMQYLTDRGLAPNTISLFKIGYAPNEWTGLRDHLSRKGYSVEEQLRAGLIKEHDERKGSFYDRFRGRIMFPIMDAASRVVAFSGRIFPNDPDAAKYLNSPETELFQKSRTLYGFHRAKSFVRDLHCSIIVEGQMDLVMSHQAGYGNTVAASGTGITGDHLDVLGRISPNIVMAFDADNAGVATARRAAMMALARGMEVKVASITGGKDPADLVKENPERWKDAVRNASHIIDFTLGHALQSESDPRARERAVTKNVLPFVARIPNKMDQAYFVSKIALALRISEEAVFAELQKVPPPEAEETLSLVATSSGFSDEEDVYGLDAKYLAALIVTSKEESEWVSGIRHEFETLLGAEPVTDMLNAARANEALLIKIDAMYPDESKRESLAQDFFRGVRQSVLTKERKKIGGMIREAESKQDDKSVEELIKKDNELGKQLAKLSENGTR